MYITKISIDEFRALKNIEIPIGRNLTCIAGKNGVGKSTILAILGNVGELKKKDGVLLNGNLFRGDFGSIIQGDKDFDLTGPRCEIFFENTFKSIPKSLSFRTLFQNVTKQNVTYTPLNIILNEDGVEKELEVFTKEIESVPAHNRYRLIPIKSEDYPTESKIPWPTSYLGLSRLYPVGESENLNIHKIKSEIDGEYFDLISKKHYEILNPGTDYSSATWTTVPDFSKKKGFAVRTSEYSERMNSSGQDNLGQILLHIFSFQALKEQQQDNYHGGILLIDEIDATLHPIALNKLLDFMLEKSKELDLQIVFTTHSINLLEHMEFKQIRISDDSIKTLYFTSDYGKIEFRENPDSEFLKHSLLNSYIGKMPTKKVTVLTEDSIGRKFLTKILDYKSTQRLNIKTIDISLSWSHIIKFITSDPQHFTNYIIVLDPDIFGKEENLKILNEKLAGTTYLNKTKKGFKYNNVIGLPGNEYIEKLIWDFIESLPPDSPIFKDPDLISSYVTLASLKENGPFSSRHSKDTKDIDKYKNWYKDNEDICDIFLDYWIRQDKNQQIVGKFYNDFIQNYKKIIEFI